MWPNELDYLVQKSRYAEFHREAEHERLIRSLPRRQSMGSKVVAYVRQWFAHWRAAASASQPVQRTTPAKVVQA